MAAPSSYYGLHKDAFKVNIAIDFGTDGLGLAYAIGGRVYLHSKWNSRKFGATTKPKTILLLDSKGQVNSFGMDAKLAFNGSLKSGSGGDQKKVDIQEELIAADGQRYPSDKVFIAALKHLQLESSKFLRKKKIRAQKHEIGWIITVPAIWSDSAKYKMKKWVIKAGLAEERVPNQCRIVYEPDCASLAIQYYIHKESEEQKSMTQSSTYNGSNSYTRSSRGAVSSANVSSIKASSQSSGSTMDVDANLEMHIGEKYILVDAGGGTVDIACHEIVGQFGVKEVHHPSGGPWGSCYIDDQYIKMLAQIFGKEVMEEFQREHPNVYVELIHNFQAAKATFWEKESEDAHNCRVPEDFVCYLEDRLFGNQDHDYTLDADGYQLEAVVAKCKLLGKPGLVSLNDDYLAISSMVWRWMFDYVMNPTIVQIKELLKSPKLSRNCKYLCLVGGLSCSPYFQYRMRKKFGPKSKYDLQLIIPKRPMLTVVEGAAYFGMTSNYIKARRMAKSYGICVSVSMNTAIAGKIPMEHIEQNKYWNQYRNEYLVRNCFRLIVAKGEEIWTNQVIKDPCCRTGDNREAEISMVCSDSANPKVVRDQNELATTTLVFDAKDAPNCDINVEWHFYDTQLKLVYYLEQRPQEKRELVIHFNSLNLLKGRKKSKKKKRKRKRGKV